MLAAVNLRDDVSADELRVMARESRDSHPAWSAKWSCVAKVESTYCNRRCSMGRGIRFTTEFKREAVRLVLSSGRPRTEIAEDLGVGLSSLTRWIGQYRDEEMPPELKDDLQAELKRLRKENVVLRQERDILKKAAAFFAKEGSR